MADLMKTAHERREYVARMAESPIEHRLAWTLLASERFVIMPAENAEDELGRHEIGFVMQYQIPPYRLDIALFFKTLEGERKRIAVECDGHRFHTGRAFEQRDKTRDAFLVSHGFEVWRYAGWILHYGTELAAEEIQNAVASIIIGRSPILTFRKNNLAEPIVNDFVSAYTAFTEGIAWPSRLGPDPDKRGWRHIDDMMQWINEQ